MDRSSSESSNRRYWTKYWSEHPGPFNTKDVWWRMDNVKFGYLKELLRPGMTVLDVGCGSGRMSALLSKGGFDTVLTDIEPGAVLAARENVSLFCEAEKTVPSVVCNVFDLPFKAGSFDCVISTGLLEHLADTGAAISSMASMLKKGGIFYSDIIPDKFSLLRSFSGFRKKEADFFELKLSKRDIAGLFQSTGSVELFSVFSFGVFPPFQRLHAKTNILSFGWEKLDKSRISDIMGFGYIVLGRKK